MYSREQVLHAVVPELLAHHNDGQLNAQLAQASRGIANVAFQPVEVAPSHDIVTVAWVWKLLIHIIIIDINIGKTESECCRADPLGVRNGMEWGHTYVRSLYTYPG